MVQGALDESITRVSMPTRYQQKEKNRPIVAEALQGQQRERDNIKTFQAFANLFVETSACKTGKTECSRIVKKKKNSIQLTDIIMSAGDKNKFSFSVFAGTVVQYS